MSLQPAAAAGVSGKLKPPAPRVTSSEALATSLSLRSLNACTYGPTSVVASAGR